MKYVVVTGGVVSGLGKGVTASSIGVVLKACGLRVTTIKIGTAAIPISTPQPAHFQNNRFQLIIRKKGADFSVERLDFKLGLRDLAAPFAGWVPGLLASV